MMSRVLVVLCAAFWSTSGQKCASPQIFSYSVSHKRNETGHWTAQVSMSQEGASTNDVDWKLDVVQNIAQCGNSQKTELIATTTGPSRKPDPNYELMPGLGYYRFHANTITWEAARETCAREGTHLLILNSDEEFATILKMWEKHPNIASDWRNNFLHVGLTDHVQEKEFYTLFGDHVNITGYAKWERNEPDSGPGANCAGVTRSGTLMDSACGNLLAFVCEKSL